METHYHQEHKPLIECRDHYGVKLEPGLRVAFNKGGEVRIGMILEIARLDYKRTRDGVFPKSWWRLICDIKVKEFNSEHVSTIKNINSIIVI